MLSNDEKAAIAKFSAAWLAQEGYEPAPFQKAIALQRLGRGQSIAEIIVALVAMRAD